jgi:formamidopyrimidine-DNA glycosylase
MLVGGRIESIPQRGNTIRMKLGNGSNLVIALEYGGVALFHGNDAVPAEKFHLKLNFEDGSMLTVRLTSMGCLYAVRDGEIEGNYVYRRDFLGGPSPTEETFTLELLSSLLSESNRMLKSVLIGKDAVVVGISNAAFQEIAHRAGIHPKRKASDLADGELQALFDAIRQTTSERIEKGGKAGFVDLYGRPGRHHPTVGPGVETCPRCGGPIDKLSIAGGPTYYCPACQK